MDSKEKIKLLDRYWYQTLVSGLHSAPVKDSDDLVTALKVTAGGAVASWLVR